LLAAVPSSLCYLGTMVLRRNSVARVAMLSPCAPYAPYAAGIGGIVCLLAVGVGAGCSSSTNEVPSPADAAFESATPADASADDAADGAIATDAADAAPADHIGAIFAISDTTAVDGGAKSSFRAGASFTHVTVPDGATQTKTVGPCLLEIIGEGTAAQETDVSAGAVHLRGGAAAIDLAPKSDNTYAPSTAPSSLYSGGEMLVVTGDGKDVPAFSTSLTAPSKVTLAAPAVVSGALTVKRTNGVTATFSSAVSGAAAGSVVLYFSATSTTMAFALTCTFDASAGGGTIPAAAFADFPAGPGTFDFYVKQTSRVVVAPWDIRFTASKAVVDPAGIALAGDATFE
jgi:hypothetical protein